MKIWRLKSPNQVFGNSPQTQANPSYQVKCYNKNTVTCETISSDIPTKATSLYLVSKYSYFVISNNKQWNSIWLQAVLESVTPHCCDNEENDKTRSCKEIWMLENSYPWTVSTLPMEGEEGGVAVSLIIPVGEPWEGGDVEGTARLTATPSSASPS